MIVDLLQNANRYTAIHEGIAEAVHYLQTTDMRALAPGKYAIDGDRLLVIVQEYDTLDEANEQMEAHRKYIDVQYLIDGQERVGHALLQHQTMSKPYSDEEDFMLVADRPSFYSLLSTGMFMVFFPHDLHMPCLHPGTQQHVKKAVVKVAV